MGLHNLDFVRVPADTTVFNALKAAAWEDLDLSAVVGAQRAIVFVKVTNNTGNATVVMFRRNTTDNFATQPALNGSIFANGEGGLLAFVTDATGHVDWYSSIAAGTVTVAIVGWFA